MGPVLHQHSFIQDVRGFGVLEIWVPERGRVALIHPVYLSFHSTAICHRKSNNCWGWKMHSVYNKAVPWSFNTLPIQTLLYAGELNNVLKSVTSFTAAIWSWYYTQFPGSKSPMETNRMLTALTGQRRFQFILQSYHYLSGFMGIGSELARRVSSSETSGAPPAFQPQMANWPLRNDPFIVKQIQWRTDPSISVCDPAGNYIMARQECRWPAASHNLTMFIVNYFQQSLVALHLQRCRGPEEPKVFVQTAPTRIREHA